MLLLALVLLRVLSWLLALALLLDWGWLLERAEGDLNLQLHLILLKRCCRLWILALLQVRWRWLLSWLLQAH